MPLNAIKLRLLLQDALEKPMLILITLLAGVVGSFLNMLIYRLPKMLMGEKISPLYPKRSFCPDCEHSLGIKDLWSIFSFLFSFGKCRYCNNKINRRYIMVEIITVASAVILFYKIGFNSELLYFLLLSWGLITLFWTDYENHLLPDIISLPLIWLGLIYNLYFGDIHSSILGAVFGYLSLWGVFWAFKLIRGKEGMGYGDFKLFALIGAWFGWQSLAPIVVLAAVAGIIFYLIKIRNKDQEFAFGTLLIIATPSYLLLDPFLL